MTPEQVAARFGLDLAADAVPAGLDRCGLCGTPTRPTVRGDASLCRPCTLTELGTTEYLLALAIGFRKTLDQVHDLVERHGTPGQNPRAWLTPKSWRK